jgi:hypothetical protein
MTLYTDPACTKGPLAFSTGVCVNVSSDATYQAYRYTGTPTSVTCQASGAGVENLALVGEQTVCCAP